MGIERTTRSIHWDYLLSLEDDLLRLSRFVDFSGNDAAYSLEIARVLMTAAAEADVVLKGICRKIDPEFQGRSINAYYPLVTTAYPGFVDVHVSIDRYGLVLRPWTDWTGTAPPRWWTANNKVKHERHERFSDANLKNCLNAVAGLFTAVLYLNREEAEGGALNPAPELLRIPGTRSNAMDAHPARYYYRLS